MESMTGYARSTASSSGMQRRISKKRKASDIIVTGDGVGAMHNVFKMCFFLFPFLVPSSFFDAFVFPPALLLPLPSSSFSPSPSSSSASCTRRTLLVSAPQSQGAPSYRGPRQRCGYIIAFSVRSCCSLSLSLSLSLSFLTYFLSFFLSFFFFFLFCLKKISAGGPVAGAPACGSAHGVGRPQLHEPRGSGGL